MPPASCLPPTSLHLQTLWIAVPWLRWCPCCCKGRRRRGRWRWKPSPHFAPSTRQARARLSHLPLLFPQLLLLLTAIPALTLLCLCSACRPPCCASISPVAAGWQARAAGGTSAGPAAAARPGCAGAWAGRMLCCTAAALHAAPGTCRLLPSLTLHAKAQRAPSLFGLCTAARWLTRRCRQCMHSCRSLSTWMY